MATRKMGFPVYTVAMSPFPYSGQKSGMEPRRDMNEIPVHVPKDALLTRRQFLFLTALFGADLATCGAFGYLAMHLNDYFPNNEPQNLLTPTPHDPSPTIAPTKAPEKILPTVTPKKEVIPAKNPFYVGPFNLEGVWKGQRLEPAPPIFLFLKRPDGKMIKAYVYPKAALATDPPDIMDNWQKPINLSVFNITGKKDSNYEGFIIQSGHSGTALLFGDLPMENFRRALEENGRPFNQKEFDATVASWQKAEGVLLQGNLAPRVKETDVTMNGKGLVNPVWTTASFEGAMRFSPQTTKNWEQAERDAYAKPGQYANVLDFVDPTRRLSIDSQKDIVFWFCGQNLFPGEHKTDAPDWQMTRFLPVISIKK